MNKYGLVGKKLGHSLSPVIHEYIFKTLGIEAGYKLYEISEEDSENILELMKERGIKGFNITVPYKEKVLKKLDYISDEAQKIGAINLVFYSDGKSYGYNSDYFGVLEMFEKNSVKIKGRICYVLGSGGASKSVVVALHDLGAKEIVVVTRDINLTREKFNLRYENLSIVGYEDIIGGDVVINTTPVGMYPNVDETPLSEEMIKRFDTAVDVVYNPKKTKFLKLAEKNGLKRVDGITMLVEQAIKSEELWQRVELPQKISEELEKIVKSKLE